MLAAAAPYFYHESLKQRFARHLQHAVQTSAITGEQRLWLQRLIEEPGADDNQPLQPLPRVDRLMTNTGRTLGGELTGAWVISDPARPYAPLFLDTLVSGIERFKDRASLGMALTGRYQAEQEADLILEVERVEGDPFAWRMRAIVEQQVAHLDALGEQLERIPDLHAATARHLQQQLDHHVPGAGVDVFEHPVQILAEIDPGDIQVMGTRSLADIAFEMHGAGAAATISPARSRFMDAQGHLLSPTQDQPWRAALADAGKNLSDTYEGLLEHYWSATDADGTSMREGAARALSETFAHALLRGMAGEPLSLAQTRLLGSMVREYATAIAPADGKAWQLSLVLTGQGTPKLAGVLLLEFMEGPLSGLYLFCAADGLRHFASHQQLQVYFASEQGQALIACCTSLDEYALLQQQQILQVRLDRVEQPAFFKMADSVIALQKRNLRHVLGLPAIHPLKATVRIDDALDIRHLLDHRLVRLHDSWRWPSADKHFQQRWMQSRISVEHWVEQMHTGLFVPTASWYGQLNLLDLFVERRCQLYEGVADCMRQALNRYLRLIDDHAQDARELWVGSRATENTPLISAALQRLGQVPPALPVQTQVLHEREGAKIQVGQALPVPLLEVILAGACRNFAQRYDRHLRHFYTRPLRRLDCQLRPALLNELLRDCALRLELSVERRMEELTNGTLEIFQQILDRPQRSLRRSLGDQQVEVYTLELMYASDQPALVLNNVLVLCQAAVPGLHILWALTDGLSEHESLAALEQELVRRLGSPESRQDWMSLLDEAGQARLQHHLHGLSGVLHLRARLQRLDGHFIQVLQHREMERQCHSLARSFERIVHRQLPAELMRQVSREDACADRNRQLLDRVGVTMEVMLSDALLPSWMQKASLGQLVHLSALIQNWYVACQSSKDFLYDIPEPHEFARSRLTARLHNDFPGRDLDPDRITVTITRYTAAPVALGEIPQGVAAATLKDHTTLTDYSISRFAASQDGLLSIAVSEGPWSEGGITQDDLRRMVRDLDIAAGYRELLAAAFSSTDPDYLRRLKYYTEQVPPIELLRVYAMRVRNELSEEGYRFIEGILNMPDGTGRLPILERDIIVSPLQLRLSADLASIAVQGVFIVAPKAPQPGPWLLYMLFNADFVVQEYVDETALLADLRSNENLQGFILDRLAAPTRKLLENGGFLEPHLPFSTESDFDMPWRSPGPVTLDITVLQGNALHAMFASTGQMLQWWFNRLSVTNAEEDRRASTFLWTLGAEQTLALLPGRLGALVSLWQTRGLLHASALDVVHEQWGKAASELLTAVGVLLSSRQASEQEGIAGEPVVVEPEHASGLSVGELINTATPSELWSRLKPFQMPDIALNSLSKDPLLNIWRNPANGETFAPVGGAVYRIAQDESGWYVQGEHDNGPRLMLDRHQHWQFNLPHGLKGGGIILTSLKTGLINAEVDGEMIVEARGIAQIRSRFRSRAKDIAEAHEQARLYLENSLDNLDYRTANGAPHHRVTSILSEFFDWPNPPASLYDSVRFNSHRLYSALTDSSLSPHDSERFVVGTRRSRITDTMAFSFPSEAEKRLYLTEKFFRDPAWFFKPHVVSRGSFNQGRHYRVAILLHELTHLYCGTEDIAYVEAHMPFLDLLDTSSLYRRTQNDELAAQQQALSYRTPRIQLFSLQRSNGSWEELSSRDGKGKRKILEITGKRTLDEARDAFYGNVQTRVDIMLANADSVALLMTLLGRERLV